MRPFELRHSRIQGTGAFATRPIRKGLRIVEYAGERITHAQANERYDDEAMGRHHTFLFSLNSRYCIDGSRRGNDARFFNHSCDPNCEACVVGKRIFIYALRDIEAGEELCYDYAYEADSPPTPSEKKLYRCRCGAKNCRKTILKYQPPKRTQKKAERKKKA